VAPSRKEMIQQRSKTGEISVSKSLSSISILDVYYTHVNKQALF
jgi:hypothetical protein